MKSSKPWKPHKDADARTKSATAYIKLLLANRPPDGLERHLRDLLNVLLWTITQVHGKFNTPYISEGALRNEAGEKLQHEHVNERRVLLDDLLHGKEPVEAVIARAIGCVVTKSEHSKLTEITRANAKLAGWARYEAANIRVIDRASLQK